MRSALRRGPIGKTRLQGKVKPVAAAQLGAEYIGIVQHSVKAGLRGLRLGMVYGL